MKRFKLYVYSRSGVATSKESFKGSFDSVQKCLERYEDIQKDPLDEIKEYYIMDTKRNEMIAAIY